MIIERGLESFLQSGAGAITRTLHDKLRDHLSVFDFMTETEKADVRANTALVDVTGALNAAFAVAGASVFMPKGTYYWTADLTAPACGAIVGEGDSTILKPGAAVTKALSITSVNLRVLESFKIDGSLTSGAKGLVLGDGVIWSSGYVNRVRVSGFTGANAVGYHIADCVGVTIVHPFANLNTINYLQHKISAATPTTTTIINARSDSAVTKGVKIVSGDQVTWIGLIVDSSGEEGVYLDGSGTTDITDLVFLSPRFEANYGATTTEYQFKTQATVRTVRFRMQDAYFSGSGATAKSININGAGATGIVLDHNQVPAAVAAGIIIQTNVGNGAFANWPSNLPFATIVSDTAGIFYNVIQRQKDEEAVWTDWTPTYSSDIGDAAATFSGAVTTSVARYKLVGKTLHLQVRFSGTLNGVTPNFLAFTVPTGLVVPTSASAPAWIKDNGAFLIGGYQGDSAGKIRIYKPDAGVTNFASGTAVGLFGLNAAVEID